MIRRLAGWSIAGLALLAAAGIAATRPLAYDLGSYTEAARRLLAGDTLYPLATRVPMSLGPGDYIWHPTTALLFIPLALLPDDAARALWIAGLIALAAGVGIVLLRPLAPEVRPWAAAGYVAFLPLVAEITLGNLNLATLALCLLAWHLRARPVLAGATLAFGIGIKLLPFALPLFFLAAGLGRLVLWAVGFGLAGLVVTYPLLADEWPVYLGLAAQIAGAPASSAISIAPTAVEARIMLAGVTAAVMVTMGRRASDRARADLAFVTAVAAVPLVAPTVNYPYLVFVLPLLAALVRAGPGWAWAGAAGGWAAMQVPMRPDAPPIAFAGCAVVLATGFLLVLRAQRGAGAAR